MRLEVFHAADGDCLLLSSGDGQHVLVDGGRASTFAANTQPRLQELAHAGSFRERIEGRHLIGLVDQTAGLGHSRRVLLR